MRARLWYRKRAGRSQPTGRINARKRFLKGVRYEREYLANLAKIQGVTISNKQAKHRGRPKNLLKPLLYELNLKAMVARELEMKALTMGRQIEELEQKQQIMEKRFREKVQDFEDETSRIRERLTRDLERRLDEEIGKLILNMLEIQDTLEMAIEAAETHATDDRLLKGVIMVRDNFLKKLEQMGLGLVGEDGDAFDPHVHEAIEMRPVDRKELDGQVVGIWQKGYKMKDRLIRPARVSVGTFHTPADE